MAIDVGSIDEARSAEPTVSAAAPTVLGVWAHPDDESFLAGGLLAGAARRGSRVRCLYLTRGEAGPSSGSTTDLGATRTRELEAALGHLGVHDHALLDLPDGELERIEGAGPVARIATELATVVPDVVVTFGEDGITGHPDHRRVSAWVDAAMSWWDRPGVELLHAAVPTTWGAGSLEALDDAGAFWPGYPRMTPPAATDLVLELAPDVLEVKLAALRSHATQVDGLVEAYGVDLLRALAGVERFVRPTPAARREVPTHVTRSGR